MLRAIEDWREYLGLTNFILVGHSYGGYLSGMYASWKPQHIKKLMLLSPVGVKQKPEGPPHNLKNLRYAEGRPPPRWLIEF